MADYNSPSASIFDKGKTAIRRNMKMSGKKYGPGSYFSPNAKTFTQTSGSRADQKYVIRRGKSGHAIKVYETGDTADTGRMATTPTRTPTPAPAARKPPKKTY